MHLSSSRRRLSGAGVAAALAGAMLTVAPTASAAPVFVDSETVLDPFAYGQTYEPVDGPAVCDSDDDAGGDEPTVPVVENGPAASASTSVTTTFEDTNNPSDNGTASGSATATGKLTSSGGVLNTMDFVATSTYTLNTTPGSPCYRYGYAGIDLQFEFTLSQAGFLTLEMRNTGRSYGEVNLRSATAGDDNDPYVDTYGEGTKFNSTTRVFLPAGTYSGYFEGSSGVNNASITKGGTTTVHGEFAVIGSQTAASAGKGKKYVNFPAARNCVTNTLTPNVTEKGKRAKKIQSVKFFVNDKLVKKVRNPSKGQPVAVPIAGDQDADVLARVKLEKVKKGVPAKKFEVSSSYVACS